MTTSEITPNRPHSRGLAIHKPGQGSGARWIAYILLAALLFMGARSLYGAIHREGSGVLASGVPVIGDLTWSLIIAVVVFVMGAWALHLVLNRATSVDLLIDTEQELRKVSWPTRGEVKNATLVVSIVTVVMGAVLFWADELLQMLFRFIF